MVPFCNIRNARSSNLFSYYTWRMGHIGALCATRMCQFSERRLGEMLSTEFQAMMLFVKSKVGETQWILCPVCHGKTRTQFRKDTVLQNFPFFCPKCKRSFLISLRECKTEYEVKPDAKTQSWIWREIRFALRYFISANRRRTQTMKRTLTNYLGQ